MNNIHTCKEVPTALALGFACFGNDLEFGPKDPGMGICKFWNHLEMVWNSVPKALVWRFPRFGTSLELIWNFVSRALV